MDDQTWGQKKVEIRVKIRDRLLTDTSEKAVKIVLRIFEDWSEYYVETDEDPEATDPCFKLFPVQHREFLAEMMSQNMALIVEQQNRLDDVSDRGYQFPDTPRHSVDDPI